MYTWRLIFLVGFFVLGIQALSVEGDNVITTIAPTTAGEKDPASGEGVAEETTSVDFCNYTDAALGMLKIKFTETNNELEVLEMQHQESEDHPFEDVKLDSQLVKEDKLIKCLEDNLEGRKIKRRPGFAATRGNKKRSPSQMLNTIRTMLKGPLKDISIHELREAMKTGNDLLRWKIQRKKADRRKAQQKRRRTVRGNN